MGRSQYGKAAGAIAFRLSDDPPRSPGYNQEDRLGREVAVKILPSKKFGSSERKQRFFQEARAASSLNHPNIITIHDIGSES